MHEKTNSMPESPDCLEISLLHLGYSTKQFTIPQVMELVLTRSQNSANAHAWITHANPIELREQANRAQQFLETHENALKLKPLLGIPFAVKDNIDVITFPTTAACTENISSPEVNSTVTAKLLEAGAICIGKTNMDQLATGLVGTRSPYGICPNPFNPDYLTGGSSSGSAFAVAKGMVSFALGTDTAGSGRVPAGFCNIVGLKPTRGLISNFGLVPACPSLDCISIFSLTVSDASFVLQLCAGYDSQDPYSRPLPNFQYIDHHKMQWKNLRVGIPLASQLIFFEDSFAKNAFTKAVSHLKQLGATVVETDISPCLESALLLYQGPWLAERYEAISNRINPDSENLLPITRQVLARGKEISGVEVFKGTNTLARLRRKSEQILLEVDILFLPTTPTHYKISEIAADPIKLNSNLGRYTNFVNLLDLSALALPSHFRDDGLPFGITLMSEAFNDSALLALGTEWQKSLSISLGAGKWPLPQTNAITPPSLTMSDSSLPILVFGLHLKNEPLNHELTTLGAKFMGEVKTAKKYGMKLLIKGEKKFPAIVRVADQQTESNDPHVLGTSLVGEIWEIPLSQVGLFLKGIKPPLGIGYLELEDQSLIQGFLAEPMACAHAPDISQFGGWRAFLKSQA